MRGNGPLNNISDSRYIDQLKSERDRFVAFAFSAADMLVEVDKNCRIVFAAGATGALVGEQAPELAGKDFFDLISHEDRDYLRRVLARASGNQRIEPVLVQVEGKRESPIRLLLSGYHMADLGDRSFFSFSMPRLMPGARALRQGKGDEETGLLDSGSFTEMAEEAVREGVESGQVRDMTLLSLGDYKKLRGRISSEDIHGFMREIGSQFRSHSVGGISAGHLGDDKFGLIHNSSIDIEKFAEAIQKAAAAVDPEGQGLDIASVSVKLETFGLGEEDALRAVAHVVNAFAKAGHGKFRLRDVKGGYDTMLREAAGRIAALRRMIEERDFRVVFQPIVDLRSDIPHHYEALARFSDAAGAGPTTQEVILFAENVGMIAEFDLAMCERVITIIESGPGWKRRPPVAVNVSGRSLASGFFVDALNDLLGRYPWVHQRILFEITESAEIEDLRPMNGVIQALRQAGHKVCLDDFGAGAAAFHYLKSLEVDLVKIDGAYVRNALKDSQAQAFLKSIASLCTDLGIDTIGEMIENPSTANFLIAHGVRYGQGYLYGKPSPDLPILAKPAD